MSAKGIKMIALMLVCLLMTGWIAGGGPGIMAEAGEDSYEEVYSEALEVEALEMDELILGEEWGAMGLSGGEEDEFFLFDGDELPYDDAGIDPAAIEEPLPEADAPTGEGDAAIPPESGTEGDDPVPLDIVTEGDEPLPFDFVMEGDEPVPTEFETEDGAQDPLEVETEDAEPLPGPVLPACLRIALSGTYSVEGDDSQLAGYIADGAYRFEIAGPDGFADTVTILVEDGAWECAQLNGLPFGHYVITGGWEDLPAGMNCLCRVIELDLSAENTPEAPAEATFVHEYTGEQAAFTARAGAAAPTQCTVGVGQSFTFNYVGLFTSGITSTTKFAFASSNKKVATVSSTGTVKALKAGTALIGILTNTGKKAVFKVIVKKAPTKVQLSAAKATLGIGQTKKLTVKLSPSGCLNTIAFSSSNKAVAVVASDGRITAVGKGTATITAKTYNGKKATCKVTVKAAPTGIVLSPATKNLNKKASATLKVTPIPSDAMVSCKFTSSDTSIATVDSAGKVTGKKTGTVTITAKSYNGVICESKVIVWKAPSKVTLNKKSATLAVGMTLTLKGTVPENTNPSVSWSSSNSKVASVSKGVVTAKKVGTAKITVKTSNGKKATCKVTVKAKPKSVKVTAPKTTLAVGGTTKATAKLTKNSYSPIEWSVEGDAVTVDQSGKITAVKTGVATVIATATAANIGGALSITVNESGSSSSKKIIDISKWQGTIDFDKLKPNVSLVIARASCSTTVDSKFVSYAKAMNARGIPFGVYCYSHASSATIARAEAAKLVSIAQAYNPKFYVIDAEASEITKAALVAFAEQLRSMGVKKVGAYVGHHRYGQYGFASIKDKYDFVWIPRYGANDGTVAGAIKPAYACDLWQYTSRGSVPGISGRVDVNIITGQGKSLSWFIS